VDKSSFSVVFFEKTAKIRVFRRWKRMCTHFVEWRHFLVKKSYSQGYPHFVDKSPDLKFPPFYIMIGFWKMAVCHFFYYLFI